MSESVDPSLGPPPPLQLVPQAYTSHSSHASVGPVIGVLAVIAVLGAVAVVIGRLCSGRRVMGRAHYDFEEWAESKCSSCIDGRVDPPPGPPRDPNPNLNINPNPNREPEPVGSSSSSGTLSGEEGATVTGRDGAGREQRAEGLGRPVQPDPSENV